MDICHPYLALLLRLILAVLFICPAFEKIFRIGIRGVADAYTRPAQDIHLPRGILLGVAAITSWIEFVAGILLMLGLFKYPALYMLGLDLLLVVVSFSLVRPMWDMKHVFPRLALLAALLLLPPDWDVWQLDSLWGN